MFLFSIQNIDCGYLLESPRSYCVMLCLNVLINVCHVVVHINLII